MNKNLWLTHSTPVIINQHAEEKKIILHFS